MKLDRAVKLVIAITVSECAGIIGSIFTASAIPAWYMTLPRPSFAPPNWIFGPVWTTLFALMGVAAFLVWERGFARRAIRIALGMFVVQLALNVLWSMIFFGFRSPGGALIEIGVLWIAILATMILFGKISHAAAWLLAPYILWVSFAAYLNYSIWHLSSASLSPVVCTQEARQCPDGSFVGRMGPTCEFAACPGVGDRDGKEGNSDDGVIAGIIFPRPDVVTTEYVHPLVWPPEVQVLHQTFTCVADDSFQGSETEQRMVDGKPYCLHYRVGGAAGSMYLTYNFSYPITENRVVMFEITVQAVQCGNYDDPRRSICEQERQRLDIDSAIDQIARQVIVR